ncbi:MAG: hypothetical protein M0Z46_22940 [Actinomycetota bacterium]|nr:hypothetical protein [Actinomycetota bacterium]
MLDHLLVDFIAAVQDAFDRALLERQAIEERFQVDVFLGDVSFETSYSLPGEGQPPRVRVDISIDWPTWSQTAYRSWSIGETPAEMPEAVLEVSMRIQRLAEMPSAERVLSVLPPASPPIGRDPLVRTATTVEEVHADPSADGPGDEPSVHWAVEGSYEGVIRFEEAQLEDPESLGPIADALTGWVSSTLVRMADLPLSFHPPDPAGAT